MTLRSWRSLIVCVIVLDLLVLGISKMKLTRPVANLPQDAPIRTIDPERPCSYVSAVLASEFLGHPKSFRDAKRVIPTDPLGRTSIAELVDGLKAMGLKARGVKLDPMGLVALQKTPIILFTHGSHFVVALTTQTESVVLVDPLVGLSVINVYDLGTQWAGEAVLVATSEESLRSQLHQLGGN